MAKPLAKNILKGIFVRSIGEQQIDFFKQDIRTIKDSASSIPLSLKQGPKRIDDWHNFIIENNVSEDKVRRQYSSRRFLAFFCMAIIGFSLLLLVGWGKTLTVAWVSTLISITVYLVHTLRLFQIRERNLCSFRTFFKGFCHEFKQLLPLPLARDWTLLNTSQERGLK